jgi:hypothetical protein
MLSQLYGSSTQEGHASTTVSDNRPEQSGTNKQDKGSDDSDDDGDEQPGRPQLPVSQDQTPIRNADQIPCFVKHCPGRDKHVSEVM